MSSRESKLRVCMLLAAPFPTRQGTQVFVRHLATMLAHAGHTIELVTYGVGEYSDEFPFTLHRALPVATGLRSGPSLGKPFADAALLAKAARLIRNEPFDLVHAHHIEALAVALTLRRLRRIPVIYHAHTMLEPELPTYFHGPWARWMARRVGATLDRVLPRSADAVVAFSRTQAQMLAARGVARGRIHVIPPALDCAEMRDAEPALVAKLKEELGPGPWLLYAGNPDRYQNLGLLWRSLPLVRAARPDVRVLVATTHDPATFAPELREAGNPAGVAVIRYRSLDELRALHAIAAVGLCPRTLAAGAPIKILNYLAAGLPVVACRSGAQGMLAAAHGRLVTAHPRAFADGVLSVLERGAALGEKPSPLEGDIRDQLAPYETLYETTLAGSYGGTRLARRQP